MTPATSEYCFITPASLVNLAARLFDVARGTRTRFTSDPSDENWLIWSPDGRRVAYNANPSGPLDIFVKSADGAGD